MSNRASVTIALAILATILGLDYIGEHFSSFYAWTIIVILAYTLYRIAVDDNYRRRP